MKKLLIIPFILVLTGCEAIVEDAVQRKSVRIYKSFWNSMDNEYVNFDKCDRQRIYDEGLALFGNIDVDSLDVNKRDLDSAEIAMLNQLRDNVDSLLWMFGDCQLNVLTSNDYYFGSIANYSTCSKYSGPFIGEAENDSYSAVAHDPWLFSGFRFSWITSKTSGLRYQFLSILHSGVTSKRMLSEHIKSPAQHGISGFVLDLRTYETLMDSTILNVLPYFLPDKDTIVCYTQHRTSKKDKYSLSAKKPMIVRGNGILYKVPTCVIFEERTRGVANILAHIMANLPNVTTISMSQTGGIGCWVKRVEIRDRGERIAYAVIPNQRVSNEKVDFSTPLKPVILVPYRDQCVTGYYLLDDNILAAIQHLDNCNKSAGE